MQLKKILKFIIIKKEILTICFVTFSTILAFYSASKVENIKDSYNKTLAQAVLLVLQNTAYAGDNSRASVFLTLFYNNHCNICGNGCSDDCKIWEKDIKKLEISSGDILSKIPVNEQEFRKEAEISVEIENAHNKRLYWINILFYLFSFLTIAINLIPRKWENLLNEIRIVK